MEKFDRRLVVRNNLTDLETDVVALEEQGWQLDPTVPDTHGDTVLAALRNIRAGKGGPAVPMRRPVQPQPPAPPPTPTAAA